MKLLIVTLLFAAVVGINCDCGCLTCGKHLRVISPPSAPCKVIHRGYSCNCPKPIPYSIQVPKPVCKSCPIRTYGYQVKAVECAKPKEDPKYSYTYDVQVPVKKECKCKHLYGLVASPDRIVTPAVDGCIPEKPCSRGPIIEYLPHCEEEVEYVYKPYSRQKRENPFKTKIPFKNLKRSKVARNEDQHMILQHPKVEANKAKYMNLKKPSRNLDLLRSKPSNKPFRISIPLNTKQKFFPFRKSILKIRDQMQAFDKRRLKENFIPDTAARETERTKFVELLQGKFADAKNVEICYPYSFAPNSRLEEISRKKTRSTRSITFDKNSNSFYKISESSGEAGADDFEIDSKSILEGRLKNIYHTASESKSKKNSRRKAHRDEIITLDDNSHPFYKIYETSGEVYEDDIENDSDDILRRRHKDPNEVFLRPFDIKNLIPHTPFFYIINAPIRALNHFHKLREHVSPVVKSVPVVIDTSTNYISNFRKKVKRSGFDFISSFLGTISNFPGRDLFDNLLPRKRSKRNDEDRSEELTSNTPNNATSSNENEKLANCKNGNEKFIHIRKKYFGSKYDKDATIFIEQSRKFAPQIKEKDNDLRLIMSQLKRDKRKQKGNTKSDLMNDIFPNIKEDTGTLKSMSRISNTLQHNYFPDFSEGDVTSKLNANADTNNSRRKKAIIKLVDEDDVHAFLREKLSIFSDVDEVSGEREEERDLLRPVTYETVQGRKQRKHKSGPKKLVVEKLTPKLTFDKGKPLVDVNGVRKPIFNSEKHLRSKEPGKIISLDGADVNDAIADIIAEAKLMSTHKKVRHKFMDNEMPLQVIKDKISQTLNKIQVLIHTDIEKNFKIYENLLKLQNLKNSVTNEWKAILINKRHNDVNEKIRILNKMQEIQLLKDQIVQDIAENVLDDNDFDMQNLIKILVRLQKLQCVLVRIVEDFGERIQLGTPFDVEKEIKYVDFLHEIFFVSGRNSLQIRKDLRKERDSKLEKHITLLEDLKDILDTAGEESSEEIDDVAREIWEIRNLEKLQRETILELDDKLQNGQKIRRELKIIFDLQKQLEICEQRQNQLFSDILRRNGKKDGVDFKIENAKAKKANMFDKHKLKKKFQLSALRRPPKVLTNGRGVNLHKKWSTKLKSKVRDEEDSN